MVFNFEQSEVDALGYADGTGYTVKIHNRDKDKQTKHLRANAHQVARIGSILAEGSEDAETPAHDVHIRHAQMFANMLYAMNARSDGTNPAVDAYAWERSDDGHPVTAYAHVRAAIRWSVAQLMPLYADQVMETLLDSGESIAYCVAYVEMQNRHRMTPEQADKERGCWVEGSRGWTAPGVLIDKAAGWGFPLDDDDRALVDHYLAGDGTEVTLPNGETVQPDDVGEFVTELADKATDWLNENVAPENWSFGWVDGEFYFWPESQWDDDARDNDIAD